MFRSTDTLILPVVALLGATLPASAQTTFTVDVALKTSAHPTFGMGHAEGYRIDGVEGATLQLERGVTYTFQMEGVSVVHPFYISTDEAGGFPFIGEYVEGVINSGATGNEILEFTPPMSAPNLLHYQCGNHPFMGYRLEIIDAPCYADCSTGSGAGVLDIFDFLCFQDAFATGDPYADCDGSTILDIFDFLCFQDAFTTGCP